MISPDVHNASKTHIYSLRAQSVSATCFMWPTRKTRHAIVSVIFPAVHSFSEYAFGNFALPSSCRCNYLRSRDILAVQEQARTRTDER